MWQPSPMLWDYGTLMDDSGPKEHAAPSESHGGHGAFLIRSRVQI